MAEADWVNNTICIDTGCVFGGKLTALRWPEKELVDVPAAAILVRAGPSARRGAERCGRGPGRCRPSSRHPRRQRPALDRHRAERPHGGGGGKCAAALEVMSRFAIAPQWLVYLPPTMSPAETSAREGWLERPEEAFAYFRDRGVARGRVRGEAHGFARGHRALPRRPTPRGRGSASRAAPPARSGPAPAAPSSTNGR